MLTLVFILMLISLSEGQTEELHCKYKRGCQISICDPTFGSTTTLEDILWKNEFPITCTQKVNNGRSIDLLEQFSVQLAANLRELDEMKKEMESERQKNRRLENEIKDLGTIREDVIKNQKTNKRQEQEITELKMLIKSITKSDVTTTKPPETATKIIVANGQGKACPFATVDVMFVLDGSGSVDNNFKTVINWVINIVRQLRNQMLTGYVQVGVVQYSHYYYARPWPKQIYMKTEIALGKYKEFDEFKAAMRKITLQSYTTFTGKVLEKIVSDFTGSSRYKNKNNNQIMLLMTDGKSNDPELVGPNAENLRKMGVTTFAVGVGNVNETELKTIATGTESNKRVYTVHNFDGLDSLVNQLKTTILDMVLEGGDSAVNASYKTEFAQTGFSSAFEERDT